MYSSNFLQELVVRTDHHLVVERDALSDLKLSFLYPSIATWDRGAYVQITKYGPEIITPWTPFFSSFLQFLARSWYERLPTPSSTYIIIQSCALWCYLSIFMVQGRVMSNEFWSRHYYGALNAIFQQFSAVLGLQLLLALVYTSYYLSRTLKHGLLVLLINFHAMCGSSS